MQKHSEDSQQPSSQFLKIADFEYLCFDFTREVLSYNEPIPDYSTRDNALLESSLGSPQQTFGGQLLYPTFEKQAAILFYSLIKNHPFKNGNKRIAVMSLLTFLALNNNWLSITPNDLYILACEVSESNTVERDEVLSMISEKIIEFLTPFPHGEIAKNK